MEVRNCVPGHPVSDKAISEQFPKFMDLIEKRLRVGADCYGDSSFSKNPIDLLNEIEEELLDVAGWAFPAFCRIQDIKKKLESIKNALDKPANS